MRRSAYYVPSKWYVIRRTQATQACPGEPGKVALETTRGNPMSYG